MPLKVIARLGIKASSDPGEVFKNLLLSPGSASFEMSDKIEASGRVWTSKLTAKLVHDDDLLREPCIFRIRTTDAFFIIGTPDLPAVPIIKEEHLVTLTLEYKSKTKPAEYKKVLSIAPDCE